MTDKEFEKKIADSLRHYEEQPPHDILSRIEETLAAQGAVGGTKRRKTAVLIPLYRYVAAAAAVALIIVGALYVNRRTAVELVTVPVAENTPEATPDTSTDSDSTAVAVEMPSVAEIPTLVAGEVPETQPLSETTVSSGETELYVSEFTDADETEDSQEFTEPEQPQIYRQRRGQQPSRYEKRLTAQDTRLAAHTATRRTRVTGAVYAGNYGAGTGDLSTREQDKVASANMLIQQTFDDAVPYANGLNTEDGMIMPVAESLNTQEAVLNHRMPVTLGVSVAFPLNDRLALTTGLSYSYLYSSSSQSFTSSSSSVTRELHYLGIPVGLAYTFYSAGNFNLYSQGSAMVEKAVAWRETYGISTALDHNSQSARYHVQGVQMSVNIAAGASYSFNPHLSLYIEPGVSYYFAQRHQPANYRTVHPVNFSLRVGLRFGN